MAYMPWGYCNNSSSSKSRQALNGEITELSHRHYQLGSGYRVYNPVIGIFEKPDSWSPFGAGGINSYAYCNGDPVNYTDRNGHIRLGGSSAPAAGFSKIIKPTLSFGKRTSVAGKTPHTLYRQTLRNNAATLPELQARYNKLADQGHFKEINKFLPDLTDLPETHKKMMNSFGPLGRGRRSQTTTAAYAIELENSKKQLYAGQVKLAEIFHTDKTINTDTTHQWGPKLQWAHARENRLNYYINNYNKNPDSLPFVKLKEIRANNWTIHQPE